MIKAKLGGKPVILNLMDFYLPVRGNLRRKSSLSEHTGDEASVEREISEIDRHYDFDVPSAIDWDLLIVSTIWTHLCPRKAFGCSRKESPSTSLCTMSTSS